MSESSPTIFVILVLLGSFLVTKMVLWTWNAIIDPIIFGLTAMLITLLHAGYKPEATAWQKIKGPLVCFFYYWRHRFRFRSIITHIEIGDFVYVPPFKIYRKIKP